MLKSGIRCILRNPTGDDAAEILKHMRITSDETDNMLRYSDEIIMTDEEESVFLNEYESSKDSIMISAIVDDNIVANASLRPVSRSEKCRHRAEFEISVQRKYWGEGIGSHILPEIIEEAKKIGYEKIELDVVTDNDRAISLYEKYGFKVYGTNEMAFRCRDKKYRSLYLMSRRI